MAVKLVLAVAALIASVAFAAIAWTLVHDETGDGKAQLEQCISNVNARRQASVDANRAVPTEPGFQGLGGGPSYTIRERDADLAACEERWG
jgi:hypothetical protein